ncbi:MAG: calcium/sodium antiporter [Paludibacteraceae bacterium]|nr:calcium/sodium antiporter [Paludibacteraceae bacterium]
MFEFLNTWLEAGWWVALLLIVAGCTALIKGADWLVVGASGLAKKYGVSDIVIGLTVVAFGTSMPEFVVNMVAVGQGSTEIAITNVLGSNIINTFVILGCTALIFPISSQKSTRRFDIPFSMLAALLVLLFVVYNGPSWLQIENIFNIDITNPTLHNLGSLDWGAGNVSFISGVGGTILWVFFIIFLWHTFKNAKGSESEESYTPVPAWKALLMIASGLLGLVVGGEVIVKSATSIAQSLGVSDAIIGLTVVALGTSLPELATSCMAAFKKNCDIALGNVIGSNIFNIFFILGTSACVMPLPGYKGLEIDAMMAALASLMVMLFVYTNKKREIKRWHGAVLLLVYAIYLAYRIITI